MKPKGILSLSSSLTILESFTNNKYLSPSIILSKTIARLEIKTFKLPDGDLYTSKTVINLSLLPKVPPAVPIFLILFLCQHSTVEEILMS